MRISDIGENLQRRGWLRYRQTAIMHVNNQPRNSTFTEYLLQGTVSLSFNRGHKQETTIRAWNVLSATKINTKYQNSFIHLTNDYHVGSATDIKMLSVTII